MSNNADYFDLKVTVIDVNELGTDPMIINIDLDLESTQGVVNKTWGFMHHPVETLRTYTYAGLSSDYTKTLREMSFTVDWGDGTIETFSNKDPLVADDLSFGGYSDITQAPNGTLAEKSTTHTYATGGQKTVKITGALTSFGGGFLDNTEAGTSGINQMYGPKVTSVTSWGDIPLYMLNNAFYQYQNLTSVPDNFPILVTRADNLFKGANIFNGPEVSDWTFSANLSNMNGWFEEAYAFNRPLDSWDVTNIISFYKMFKYAASFNQDLNSWYTASCQNMGEMFNQAFSFAGDISNWETHNVEIFSYFMTGASAFNSDVSGWNISAATKINSMFQNCASFDRDLSSWFPLNLHQSGGHPYSANLFLTGSGFSTTNYDKLLNAWSSKSIVRTGIVLGVGDTKYSSSAATARNLLTDTYNWIITDGGQDEFPATVPLAIRGYFPLYRTATEASQQGGDGTGTDGTHTHSLRDIDGNLITYYMPNNPRSTAYNTLGETFHGTFHYAWESNSQDADNSSIIPYEENRSGSDNFVLTMQGLLTTPVEHFAHKDWLYNWRIEGPDARYLGLARDDSAAGGHPNGYYTTMGSPPGQYGSNWIQLRFLESEGNGSDTNLNHAPDFENPKDGEDASGKGRARVTPSQWADGNSGALINTWIPAGSSNYWDDAENNIYINNIVFQLGGSISFNGDIGSEPGVVKNGNYTCAAQSVFNKIIEVHVTDVNAGQATPITNLSLDSSSSTTSSLKWTWNHPHSGHIESRQFRIRLYQGTTLQESLESNEAVNASNVTYGVSANPSGGISSSVTFTGLASNTAYTIYVEAEPAGEESSRSSARNIGGTTLQQQVAPSWGNISGGSVTEGQGKSINLSNYINSSVSPGPTYSIISDSSQSGDKFSLVSTQLVLGAVDYEVEGSSVSAVVRATNSVGHDDVTVNINIQNGNYGLEAPYWGAPPNDRDQFILPSIAENSGNTNIPLSSYVSDFGGPNPSFEIGIAAGGLDSNSHTFQGNNVYQVPGMANGTYISVSGTKGTQNWTLVIPDLDYEAISTKIGDGVTQYGETLGFRIPLVIRTESEGEYRWGNMQFSVMVTNDTSDDPLDTASSTAFATALESSSDGGLTGANSTTMVKTVISSGTTGNNLIVQGKFGTPTSLFGIAGDPGLASERTVVITKNFNGAPSETHVITGTSSYSSIWDSNLNNVEVVGNGSYSFEGSTGFREVTVSGGGVGCTYMNRMFKGTMAGGTATLDLSRFSGRFVQDYVYFCENCTSLTTIKMPSPSVMSDGSETTLGGHFKSHCAPLVTNSTILINGMFKNCVNLKIDQPDWERYVNGPESGGDLLGFYNTHIAPSGRSKKDWGMHHYANHGLREGRVLADAGSTMWNWDTSKVRSFGEMFYNCQNIGANYMSSDSSQFVYGKHIDWNNTYSIDYTHPNHMQARIGLVTGEFWTSTDSQTPWQGSNSVVGFDGAMKILASVGYDNGGNDIYSAQTYRRSPTHVIDGESETFNMSTMGFEHWDCRSVTGFREMFYQALTLPRTQIFLISQAWNPNINSIAATTVYGHVGSSDVAQGPYKSSGTGAGEPLAIEQTSNYGSPYRYMFYRASEQDVNSHILPGTLKTPSLNVGVTTSTDGRTGNTANETRPAINSDRASGVIGHKLVLPGVYGHDDFDESYLFKAGKNNNGTGGYADLQGMLVGLDGINSHLFQGFSYGTGQISFSRWAKENVYGSDVGNYEFNRGAASSASSNGVDERDSVMLIPPHGYAAYVQNGRGGNYSYSVNGETVYTQSTSGNDDGGQGSSYQPPQGLGYQNPYPTTTY